MHNGGRTRTVMAPAIMLAVSACAASPAIVLPSGEAAYVAIPEGDVLAPRETVIGPGDELSISVFREPDLSLEKANVDSNGDVQVPLLGAVPAAGLTSAEFARALEDRYRARYLVDPSISVAITQASLRRVTVTGAVTKPGMYEMPGRISLIDAVALASGPTNVAKFRQVVIFRRVDGGRYGAVFDLGAISAGSAPDIEVLPGDQIIVGTDNMKQLYRDALTAAPLISIFRPFN